MAANQRSCPAELLHVSSQAGQAVAASAQQLPETETQTPLHTSTDHGVPSRLVLTRADVLTVLLQAVARPASDLRNRLAMTCSYSYAALRPLCGRSAGALRLGAFAAGCFSSSEASIRGSRAAAACAAANFYNGRGHPENGVHCTEELEVVNDLACQSEPRHETWRWHHVPVASWHLAMDL